MFRTGALLAAAAVAVAEVMATETDITCSRVLDWHSYPVPALAVPKDPARPDACAGEDLCATTWFLSTTLRMPGEAGILHSRRPLEMPFPEVLLRTSPVSPDKFSV